MKEVIPVILCGGKGTRLWPLSRRSYPKQFLSLCGENDKSLLQKLMKGFQILREYRIQLSFVMKNIDS